MNESRNPAEKAGFFAWDFACSVQMWVLAREGGLTAGPVI
ncbi:hypothetical protein PG5_66490 [Pseudomonas sp. G5(2012)]|jgi:hypothetical protein|nr:hypothetical protein PG5_66490 [Pseudomonas sp. G5(2012)]